MIDFTVQYDIDKASKLNKCYWKDFLWSSRTLARYIGFITCKLLRGEYLHLINLSMLAIYAYPKGK